MDQSKPYYSISSLNHPREASCDGNKGLVFEISQCFGGTVNHHGLNISV